MEGVIEHKFPADGLVPKSETGTSAFLLKYPEYNGDGVTIAIFDSGVDPRADGLQTTPDGTPKVIERYDCSGSGDVDTSTKLKPTPEGYITGLSGRKLWLTDAMLKDNTVDEFHVGLKNVYELFPKSITDTIVADKKLKHWDAPHKDAVVAACRHVDSFEESPESSGSPPAVSLFEKLNKENATQSLDMLNALAKKYADIKPTYDCVVYRDQQSWVAVIDANESGVLSEALVLREYSQSQDIRSIDDNLSISINVHGNGDVLEIVGICSGHGTHVASIASGNHEDVALNGIAPAAKIVSMTIGDSRLGSMETGTALVRAMIKVMELCESGRRIHVINMSYGEHAHFSTSGRVGELICEVVNKYGVIWVASAGNHGPALCTIGTPPDLVQPCLIGVGAYVSPEMIEAEYALRHKLAANCYTWTSRDPCIDGGQGVTVCAPGAAIASVPEFTMAKQQLMNGTSMAAPHVAGASALIVSGLLKNNIQYSPFFFKRALWNTATHLPHIDKFAQGNGLLNTEKAYEYLVKFQNSIDSMIRYSVVVGASAKGIHCRDCRPCAKEYPVTVEPVFMNDKEAVPDNKIKFNVRCTLVASESWVTVATYLDLSYGARSFNVLVDPTALPPGVHTAKVCAYDSSDISRGTIFEVPITIVQPNHIDVDQTNVFTYPVESYKSNSINRNFIVVPDKATWAVLRLRSKNSSVNVPDKFMVHTLQLFPHRYCKELETQKLLSVNRDTDTVHAFKCVGNNVLEVCIAKYWSSFGSTQLEASIEFRGIVAKSTETMHSANGLHRIDLATLNHEDVSPSIQCKHAVMVLKPVDTKIRPLTDRDVIPPARQIYQNIITYNLHLNKAQDVSLHAAMFSDVLYESEFETQFWQVFDGNKMVVGCGDAYSNEKFLKLEKGDYVVRLQIRHEKQDLLEKVNESTMLATFKLAAPIALDAFTSYKNAINNHKKITSFVLARNKSHPIFVTPLSNEKITKGGVPNHCSWLTGSISFAKDEVGRKVENHTFKYILSEGPTVKKTNGSTANKESKSKLEEYNDGLRDFKNNMLTKLDLDKSEEVYAELIRDFPDFHQAHLSIITKLESSEKTQLPFTYRAALDKAFDYKSSIDRLQRVVDLCDKVISSIDAGALLAYFGIKSDNRPDAAKIKTNMEKKRTWLIEAYVKKSVAISKLQLIAAARSSDECGDPGTPLVASHSLVDVQEIYKEVGKFSDYTDNKVQQLIIWFSFQNAHYGRLLKALQKMYDDKLQKDVLTEMRYVANELTWSHVATQIDRALVFSFAAEYPSF